MKGIKFIITTANTITSDSSLKFFEMLSGFFKDKQIKHLEKLPGMITRTIFIFSFFFCFLFYTTNLNAKLPKKQIKGIDSPLQGKYSNLSPLGGIVWSEGNILNNIVELNEKLPEQKNKEKNKMPLSQLEKKKEESNHSDLRTVVNELFHRIDNSFLPTKTGFRVGSYLHTELLGKISGFLENVKNTNTNDDTVKALAKIIFNDEKVINDFKKNKEHLEEKISTLVEIKKKKKSNNEKENEERIRTEKSLINDINRLLFFNGNLEQNYLEKRKDEQYHNNNLQKMANDLAKKLLMSKSHPQLNNVLTSYLWHMAQKKEDYLAYYKGLATQLKNINLDDKGWLNESFSSEEAKENQGKLNSNDSYDKKVFKILYNNQKNAPLQYTGHTTFNGDTYPDCGETSLRNFFKIILNFDDNYNIKILDNMKPKKNKTNKIEELKEFFKKFNTSISQNDQNARDSWGKIVANLPGVIYARNHNNERSEIHAGSKNMLKAIKALLGLDEDEGMNWEKLMGFINEANEPKDRESREIKIIKSNIAEDFGSIEFSTKHEGNFNWKFEEMHFTIDPASDKEKDPEEELNNSKETEKLLSDFINKKEPLSITDVALLDLISLYPITDKKLEVQLEHMKKPTEKIKDLNSYVKNDLYILCLNKINNTVRDNKNVDIEKVLNNLEKSGITFNNGLILALYKLTNSNQTSERIIQKYFTNTNPDYPKLVEELIKKRTARKAIVEHILKNKGWEKHSKFVEQLINEGRPPVDHVDYEILEILKTNEDWKKDQKTFVKLLNKLIKKGNATKDIITQLNNYWKYPNLVKQLIVNGRPDSAQDVMLDTDIVFHILSADSEYWVNHPDLIEKLINKIPLINKAIDKEKIKGKKEELIRYRDNLKMVISNAFKKEDWQGYYNKLLGEASIEAILKLYSDPKKLKIINIIRGAIKQKNKKKIFKIISNPDNRDLFNKLIPPCLNELKLTGTSKLLDFDEIALKIVNKLKEKLPNN
ncbi:MAG: hypothetical protein HQK49_19930 [Oligoflexia bacterium]|nr:hypothetical protein [Oligoflexia bacterium]